MTVTGIVENGQIVLATPLDLPNGTSVEVELRFLSTEVWGRVTVEELARRQGVRSPPSLDDLAVDWPEEESLDEFLTSVREGRK